MRFRVSYIAKSGKKVVLHEITCDKYEITQKDYMTKVEFFQILSEHWYNSKVTYEVITSMLVEGAVIVERV